MTVFPDALIVWSTAPEEPLAATIAETLVREKLAACVHVMPRGQSFYEWEERLNRDTEWTLMIKTRRDRYPALEKRLKELHPYTVPEILVTPVEGGSPEYLEWLVQVTEGPATG